MKAIPTISSLISVTTASLALANTPLLVNTDFAVLTGDDVGWSAGSNSFIGGVWQAFILDGYTLDERVDPDGSGFVFSSWDDGASDTLENFLFQEYGAGPAEPTLNTTFQTGDVLVFKGRASATRTGSDTSDMIVRAFIKTLGYNESGWAFQIKSEYSDFHDIGSDLEAFELSITYPDLAVDDSLQVIQFGFEITNSFDGAAMDAGTIYFEGIEAYIEADTEMWKGFEVLTDPDGWVDTGTDNLGWLYIRNDPYVFSDALGTWIFMPEATDFAGSGNWLYFFKN